MLQVFKIHVAKAEEDWFIFRRYTDFVRLNDKVIYKNRKALRGNIFFIFDLGFMSL